MPAESSYIPGICNINKAEIAYRKKAMWFGIVASAMLVIILLILDAPWWLSPPLLFIPVYIGAIGYLQVRYKFCVSYASQGQQHADDDSEAKAVISDEARKTDKAKVRSMNTQAFALTVAVLCMCAALQAV